MYKKIIPLILASSIVFSCIAPASAADAPTTGEVVNDIVQSSMAGVIVNLAVTAGTTAIGAYFGQPQVGAFFGPVVAGGLLDYADYIAAGYTDQDIYDQFTNYNAQLETDLGTATLIDGGIRLAFPATSISTGAGQTIDSFVQGTSWSIICTNGSNRTFPNNLRFGEGVTAPFSATGTFGGSVVATGGVELQSRWKTDTVTVSPGAVYYGTTLNFYAFAGNTGTLSGSVWISLYPTTPVQDHVSVDISTPSRPTSLVTPIAIQNPDQTYTVYNNITLVDEGNSVVFDPTTGESITFTDWAYDYESRTYDLTLDGGGNMTVQFGNDSITMTQGDTVTNIFYVQDPADDPGTDNPDDPDNPGTDADVSGFFAWWKNAWNGFVDRLFTVLDGGDLEVILPGEEGNPEDEEDDGWTVFDLFALIRDALWKIITGVITVVLDGFLGLVDAIASLGDFFDIYDPANPDGIFGVPGGGVELWS